MADPWVPFGRLPPAGPVIPNLGGGYAGPPISYTEPQRQPYGGTLGQSAGPAPTWMDRAAGYAGQAGNIAAEMTGFPAAGRAGTAAAAGNIPQAVGEGLMALPSRMGSILGFPLSQAEAQTVDPRQKRLDTLDAQIGKAQAEIKRLGERTMKRDPKGRWVPDLDRLQILSKPYQQTLDSAVPEATRLREALQGEFQAGEDARLARERGAAWRNTPTARAYPWSQPTATGAGLAVGAVAPFMRARSLVRGHNTRLQELDTQIGDAVARARNARLTPQARTQAANEARAAQTEFEQIAGRTPHPSTLGSAGIGFTATEVGTGSIPLTDYLSSAPGDDLRNYTLQSNNPVENPGEMAARYLIPGAVGAGLGKLGAYLGSGGVERPTGQAGAVQSLNKRYTKRSR